MNCPCDYESKENCQHCRDKDTRTGLYNLDEIKQAMKHAGLNVAVQKKLIEGLGNEHN